MTSRQGFPNWMAFSRLRRKSRSLSFMTSRPFSRSWGSQEPGSMDDGAERILMGSPRVLTRSGSWGRCLPVAGFRERVPASVDASQHAHGAPQGLRPSAAAPGGGRILPASDWPRRCPSLPQCALTLTQPRGSESKRNVTTVHRDPAHAPPECQESRHTNCSRTPKPSRDNRGSGPLDGAGTVHGTGLRDLGTVLRHLIVLPGLPSGTMLHAKVTVAEETERDIDATRQEYVPVAVRTQILFFCVSDLANVDPMYQYCLEWFLGIFVNGIANSEIAWTLSSRKPRSHSSAMAARYSPFEVTEKSTPCQVQWAGWMEHAPNVVITPETSYADIIVPTLDTVRTSFLLDMLLTNRKPTYGAQPPIELLRQWMDHRGWYDRKQIGTFKQLVDINFACAMGPPGGGRNPVTQRFTRHFNLLALAEMEDASKRKIFSTILGSWMGGLMSKKEPGIPVPALQPLNTPLVDATLRVYSTITSQLLPTPAKSHYTFNLRDLSKVFQGVLMAEASSVEDKVQLLRLWYHESCRVFQDRLVSPEDRDWFERLLQTCVEELGCGMEEVVPARPVLYGDFMIPGADNKLVLFMDALRHVCSISRVLRQPLGNALLLGVGGSGRQSLARLASHISDYECFQIELSKNYGQPEWREDIKGIMLKAGLTNQQITFLFVDTQDVNSILNSGDVPNLYAADEQERILAAMKPVVQSLGQQPTKANLMAAYVKRVRSNIHTVLCMSLSDMVRVFPVPPGEGLAPAAAHPQQQGVAQRLAQDAADGADVAQGSPYRTGLAGTTSSMPQPSSSTQACRSRSNQSRSSGLTSRSWNTRQLSWYQRRSSWTLSWWRSSRATHTETPMNPEKPDALTSLNDHGTGGCYSPIQLPRMVEKIFLLLASSISARASRLKWRVKRCVTGLRPPPGGPMAHAKLMSTSCLKALKRWRLSPSPVAPTLHTRENMNQGSTSSPRRFRFCWGGGFTPCTTRGLRGERAVDEHLCTE
ncbi:hypothetical protein CRUP_029316 [Coryphaenoides rupestris]|nr:hypothetical protein CRUP_029316 [Coryphaenoides rupestris]